MRSIAFVLLISSISAVFAQPSAKWTVLGKEYAVDTLKHCQVGPGTVLTILDLTGTDRQRVFFTTTDLTNHIVRIKTICGNNNLKTNLTIPQMIENNGDKANEYFAGVNADLFSANGPIGTTVVDSEIFKTARSTTDWYSVGADAGKSLHFGQFYTTFRLTSTATGQMSAKSVNTPRESNDFVIYTDKYGASTGTKSSGVEVAARRRTVGTWHFQIPNHGASTVKCRKYGYPVRRHRSLCQCFVVYGAATETADWRHR